MTLKPLRLLGAIALALLLAIAFYWLVLATPRALPAAVAPDAASLRPHAVARPAPASEMIAAIVARPLFIPGRRPVDEPAIADTGSETAPADAAAPLILRGVIGGGTQAVAIIAKGGAIKRVSKGQVIDGWKLDQVNGRVARFVGLEGETMELKLEHLVGARARSAKEVAKASPDPQFGSASPASTSAPPTSPPASLAPASPPPATPDITGAPSVEELIAARRARREAARRAYEN